MVAVRAVPAVSRTLPRRRLWTFALLFTGVAANQVGIYEPCLDYEQLVEKLPPPSSHPLFRPETNLTVTCKVVSETAGLCEPGDLYGELCPKSCGACSDDGDDGFLLKYNWENLSDSVFMYVEVFIVGLAVLFFLVLPDAHQERVFACFDGEENAAPTAGSSSSSQAADIKDGAARDMIKPLLLSGGDNSGAAEEGFIGTSRGDSGGGRELDKAAMLQGPPQTGGDANTNNARIAQKKQRLYFVDNLRSFLTAVVVVHHVVCQVGGNGLSGTVNLLVCTTSQATYAECFDGQPFFVTVFSPWLLTINQTYFMGLFFFISGIFSPSSLRRKGCRLFLKDKVKRLGLPYLAWQLFLGPFLNEVFIPTLIFDVPALDYDFLIGPPWFIRTLLSFNVVYAFCPGELPANMNMPSIPALLFFFGVPVGLCYTVFSWQPFTFGAPGGMQYLLTYVAWFTGGLVAGKNEWMREVLQFPARTGRFLYALCALIMVLTFMFAKLSVNYPDLNSGDYEAYSLLEGVWAVAISLALLNFFAKHANVNGPFWSKINASAYLVYMIHFYFLTLCLWLYSCSILKPQTTQLAKTCGADIYDTNLDIDWDQGCESGKPAWWFFAQVDDGADANGFVWGAFFFVSVGALVLSWTVSYALKQLPYVRDVM